MLLTSFGPYNVCAKSAEFFRLPIDVKVRPEPS